MPLHAMQLCETKRVEYDSASNIVNVYFFVNENPSTKLPNVLRRRQSTDIAWPTRDACGNGDGGQRSDMAHTSSHRRCRPG